MTLIVSRKKNYADREMNVFIWSKRSQIPARRKETSRYAGAPVNPAVNGGSLLFEIAEIQVISRAGDLSQLPLRPQFVVKRG